MHNKIIFALVLVILVGGLSIYDICRRQRPGDDGTALDHVAELTEQLARAEDLARRGTERADRLAERNTTALESLDRIANGLADSAIRGGRIDDLIDSIIAAVRDLEAVYNVLDEQP